MKRKRYKKWWSEWTVCGEMNRRGWLSDEDFANDLKYNVKTVSVSTILIYKATIIPLVIGMKLNREFARVVARIAWKGWLSDTKMETWR